MAADLPGLRGRTAKYEAWRWRVHMALYDAGYMTEALDFLDCEDPDTLHAYRVCPEDPDHYTKAVVHTCHKPYCPDCARRETARKLSRYLPHMEERVKRGPKQYRLRHIVLTTSIPLSDPDVKPKMRAAYKQVSEFFDQVLGKGWHKTGQGYVASADFGEEARLLHFHVLFFGRFIQKTIMSDTWEALTGFEVTFIRQVTPEEGVKEVLKYATKLTDLKPEEVLLLRAALKGFRRVRSRGCFFGITLIKQSHVCPTCGAVIEKWSLFKYQAHIENLDLKRGNKSGGKDPPKQQSQALQGVLI